MPSDIPDTTTEVLVLLDEATGLADGDARLARICERIVRLLPECEPASHALFATLVESKQFQAANNELDRFQSKTGNSSAFYTSFSSALQRESDQSESGDVGDLFSRVRRGLKPRYNPQQNTADYLDGVRKHIGEGNRRKQGWSDEKSQQRLKNSLGGIGSKDDAEKSNLNNSRVDT